MKSTLADAGRRLPAPAQEGAAHSARLAGYIRNAIAAAGGSIGFDRYMELAQYAPGLGYYNAGASKFGAAGDFVTAPELGPLFARCLARQAAEVLAACGGGLLEAGPGSGALAAELLAELQRLGRLPAEYTLLEVSPELKRRQQERLASAPCPVRWLDTMPQRFTGLVLANELLDAFPVQRFVWRAGELLEQRVGLDGSGGFVWREQPGSEAAALGATLASWLADCPEGYVFEWNARALAWIGALAASLWQGVALIVDYGYARREFFHPQRQGGTLLCHYRHHAHDDPFLWPGLNDITASLDFTALAEAARQAGLEVRGYASQAGFLLGCGLEAVLQALPQEPRSSWLQRSREALQLTNPGGMGERFKVLALGRGWELPLRGFAFQDWRGRL